MPKRSTYNILLAHPRGTAQGTLPVTPHVISSSDTFGYAPTRKAGSTGVKQKNLFVHHVITDATKSSGELLAHQMKAMADINRELKYGKVDVQLKLFAEQMEYQCEKDRRLYKSSRIVHENARLLSSNRARLFRNLQNCLVCYGVPRTNDMDKPQPTLTCLLVNLMLFQGQIDM
jgi:hypothetical protein